MVMPDELAFKPGCFHLLAIQFSNNPWIPVITELAELFADINFFHEPGDTLKVYRIVRIQKKLSSHELVANEFPCQMYAPM